MTEPFTRAQSVFALALALLSGTSRAQFQSPTSAPEIVTDRPDVTESGIVGP